MMIAGWGNYPEIETQSFGFDSRQRFGKILAKDFSGIARGLGRSYGDSSLAKQTIDMIPHSHFLNFDRETGVIDCEAGVSLEEILDVSVPAGWFLPVTPGTKFVTVGGAIASDVHGKNHHKEGAFSDYVLSMQMLLGNGEVVTCSPTENRDLFCATSGGMGLTGVILAAQVQLKPIQSAMIDQLAIKTKDLNETLDLFDEHNEATYSVAWIDCVTKKNMGRSVLLLGEHAKQGELKNNDGLKLNVPFQMPSFLLNSLSVSAFNKLYYWKHKKKQESLIHYDPFFYPLDSIHNWNRVYGKKGFTQYQFVVPKKDGHAVMKRILSQIVNSKRGSFLAVLKSFGPGNNNPLSFPMEGYTLALDFKIQKSLFPFLEKLDQEVLAAGGRVYLTKDVRMSADTFAKSYPRLDEFLAVRKKYHADGVFYSEQSKRLGIDS